MIEMTAMRKNTQIVIVRCYFFTLNTIRYLRPPLSAAVHTLSSVKNTMQTSLEIRLMVSFETFDPFSNSSRMICMKRLHVTSSK